jgi:hypothetical protein
MDRQTQEEDLFPLFLILMEGDYHGTNGIPSLTSFSPGL